MARDRSFIIRFRIVMVWVLIVSFFIHGIGSDFPFLAHASNPDPTGAGTTAGVIGGTLPTTLFDSQSQSNWNANQGQQLAAILTSCSNYNIPLTGLMNSANQALQSSIGGKSSAHKVCALAGGVSVTTVCPGGGDVPDFNMTCDLYNPTLAMQIENELETRECAFKCEKAKIEAIQGELKCIQSAAASLAQKASGLPFGPNIQRMQTDEQNIRLAIEDRELQIQDVEAKLKGGVGGSEGLLALQQRTIAMINQLPAQIQQQRAHYQTTVQLQKSLDAQKSVSKAARTMDCFQHQVLNPKDKCEVNGSSVSSMDYLFCRFRQMQSIGKNGQYDPSLVTANQGESKTNELKSIVNQIIAQAPNMAQVPQTADDQKINSQQPLLNLTVADIQNRYGDRLEAVGGQKIEDYVINSLAICEQQSTQAINAESDNPNTAIGQAEFKIRDENQNVAQEIKTLANQINQQYAANMAGLTGQNLPLNTSACDNAPVSAQMNCLQDMQNQMQGLLMGNSSASAMQIQIKGSNPSSYVNFTCKGLNGCVTTMQNVSRNLASDSQKLKSFRTQYVQKAFQSTEAAAKQYAASMNASSQMLQQQIQNINAGLTSLGVAGVSFPPIQGQPLQKDENGLPVAPQNALGLIGQYVNPPLPDMSGGSTASSSGITEATNKVNANNAKVQRELAEIKTLEISCSARRNEDILRNLVTRSSALDNANCHLTEACRKNPEVTLNTLSSALTNLLGSPAIPPSSRASLATLESGVQTYCDTPDGVRVSDEDMQKRRSLGGGLPTSACASFYSSLIAADKMISVQGSGNHGVRGAGAFGAGTGLHIRQ